MAHHWRTVAHRTQLAWAPRGYRRHPLLYACPSDAMSSFFRARLEHAALIHDVFWRHLCDVPELRDTSVLEAENVHDRHVSLTWRVTQPGVHRHEVTILQSALDFEF